MSRYLIIALLLISFQDNFTLTEIIRNYNPQKNETTLRLPSSRLSGPKDRYHSLSYAIYYSYPGTEASPPKDVNFELVSVVKARQLNTDLYVVFVVDGKEVHFSSNRIAMPKPVAGRQWIGERMVFSIPREEFVKLAAAEKLGVKLGGVSFEFNEAARASVRAFAEAMKQ
ncbi:MAG TPA: hypothetical protein VJT15_11170 [Pyrinomonadaceae bacterium]|nr:hypothetical protein [Pyrinomonadaceae bacterium]